ncbi:MAG: NTP transferase domain-containing protein [Bacteroidia bacterium]|nr:NTP transferase domain-containing protein [Bacteroidia bacterium]
MEKVNSNEHNKHPKLAQAVTGHFHKNEWSILGTDCTTIKSISETLTLSQSKLKAIYVDADHDDENTTFYSKSGKMMVNCNFHMLNDEYGIQMQCNEADFVLVNGNHYRASKQIIVVDKEKEGSLLRRISDCNNVEMILVKNNTELFPFLKSMLGENATNIPVYDIDDVKGYTDYFAKQFNERRPEVTALILAGGESKRMGEDKSQMDYHGMPHELYTAKLTSDMGFKTIISKQEGYKGTQEYPILRDKLTGMGPFGAICSAMMYNPNTAWLVISCDLPFVNKELINTLIKNRDISKFATTVKAINKEFPEPLITIYEPKAYQRFLELMSRGVSCPRKVIINSDVKVVELEDERLIQNVNTPEEYKDALNDIGNETE